MFLLVHFITQWINGDRDKIVGAIEISVFILIVISSVAIKIPYIFYANKLAVNVNRGISALLYQKVLKLSQISLAKASTGKLVTLVSGDLQTLEKTMWFIPYIFVAPLLLIACFAYFAVYFYEASAITFIILVLLVIAFIISAVFSNRWKYLEGKRSKV